MADKSLNRDTANLDDAVWDHKWGFADTRFVMETDGTVSMTGSRYNLCGFKMPYLLPFAEEMLGVKFNPQKSRRYSTDKGITPPNKNTGFCADIERAFKQEQFSFDDRHRLLCSHGQTTVEEVSRVLYGKLDRVLDMVFWPESDEDCTKIIELAGKHNVCLVPYGGGTSVSCALQLPQSEQRMIVAVDMRRMNKILWVDKENFQASVQAGITGQRLEDELAKVGFTSGHEPDSVELSTLGGWIATNASGMKKNRYGNIENIVQNVTLVTPAGVIEQVSALPRVSMGMQIQNALFGCEGNLGLITKAVIKIHKLPEVKRYGSVAFPDFKHGVDFLYELSQTGVLPASIRLVDNVQFRFGQALKAEATGLKAVEESIQRLFVLKVKKFDPHQMCAATLVLEGTAEEVAHQEKVVYGLAKRHGGLVAGATNGQRGYMLTYAIAYIRDFLADFHVIGETYETTVPWSKIHDVCNAVDVLAKKLHKEHGMPGVPYVSPRITQLYHTGVCIYFTHGFSCEGVEDAEGKFSIIEHQLRQTIMDHGGSISHHHGVGKLRKGFMQQTISPSTVEMIADIKQKVDPNNIFGIRNNVFAE